MKDTSGIVYVFTNPAMTGIVKIGLTKKDEIDLRLKELFTTSVPVPFECAFACKVEECSAVENALHTAFHPNRIHPKREFFKIEPEQAIVLLRLFQKSDITKEINKKIDSETLPEDKIAGEELKTANKRGRGTSDVLLEQIIPVIKSIEKNGKAYYTYACKEIASKVGTGIAPNSVMSQCTRGLKLKSKDDFLAHVENKTIKDLLIKRYPDRQDIIEKEL